MNSVPDRQARDGVVRWIDEGPNVLRALLGILNDYNRLRGTAETAERECERLREEVSQLPVSYTHLTLPTTPYV